MPSRRRFLSDCATAALSAALIPVSMATPRRSPAVSTDDLSFATFAELLNSRFISRASEGEMQSLRLVEAVLDPHTAVADGEKFSLLFRGDATRRLAQDTYRFEHPRLGRFDMFIVPVGRENEACCYYEAIFNRLPTESRAHLFFAAATQLT